ncbi:hypothetical protein H6F63_28995 [Trichocoleus sp. FACHB-40]|nr:hypothetical protein [Trichocoleus sp. FACHB-40]
MWFNCLLSSTQETITPFRVGFGSISLTRTEVMNNVRKKLKAQTRYQALHQAIVNDWIQ